MSKITLISVSIFYFLVSLCYASSSVGLDELPAMPKDTYLFQAEKTFGYRGKVSAFVQPPCKIGAYYDRKIYYTGEEGKDFPKPEYNLDHESIKVVYKKDSNPRSFCGAYIILLGDLSTYKTVTFLIKGQNGGETFEIGINDIISNKREDAVFAGSVNKYLSEGITKDWQLVKIPLSDFSGPDLSKVYSLIFHFNEVSEGTLWIDEIRFYKEDLVLSHRADEIKEKGYFLLNNFDYSDLNLLGRKSNTYKRLPSTCICERVQEEHYGRRGRSLKLNYKKEANGWCGYYTLLNQVDGEYYDLSGYKSVSFMVKGETGGEKFEIGMADKNWLIIGDSLKAGSIDKYLKGGVTTKWQEVVISLEDFGLLDLSQMGSFVINFNEKGEGAIYIDDLKFYLK